jgi:cyclopropane fatty-acyl-phospholipid synthase-like methyltransferase
MSFEAREITERVKAFYRELPFNYYGSTAGALEQVKVNPLESMYPDLARLLASGQVRNVLELGCGAGWLTNTIAYHYGIPVRAVDFTTMAIERARDVAKELGISGRVTFVEANILEFKVAEPVDLMVSIGVIPAMPDAPLAYAHMQESVAPGKYLYLGLYHLYGRRVFLDLFRGILEKDGEEAALEKYRRLDSARRGDDTHLKSWFRDQVLHPHENLQTLHEVVGWLSATGFELRSTSINGFDEIESVEDLFEVEKAYAEIAYHANYVEERYFPGFFTVMAQRIG